MLLCLDIGNTNIKYAVYEKDELKASYRVSSRISRTADEYGSTLLNLLKSSEIAAQDIDGIIMSSVIPNLNYTMTHMCEFFFKITPIVVNSEIKTDISIKVDNPKEVGADIIANSNSAYHKYFKGKPFMVIDFGTATTFDIVNGKGELIGVVIAPGIRNSVESLSTNAAQLPHIEITKPKSAIAKNTVECMQAGLVFGFAGLVENIVKKVREELGEDSIEVYATGGLSEIISKEVSCITLIDRKLTLEGLKRLYEINK